VIPAAVAEDWSEWAWVAAQRREYLPAAPGSHWRMSFPGRPQW